MNVLEQVFPLSNLDAPHFLQRQFYFTFGRQSAMRTFFETCLLLMFSKRALLHTEKLQYW